MADDEAELDAYQQSEECRAEQAKRQAAEDELILWLASHPGVQVTSHGGKFPEQWWGTIDDGRSWYFRERGGTWRIELDLRPTGQFYLLWKGGDFDDEASYEPEPIEKGDVTATGTVASEGYGDRPAERAAFIVGVVRDHLRRQSCKHATGSTFCPDCGTRLAEDPTP